ncbi:hypothetical protein [Brevibacterium moorei]|uniref:hypothetical protein n=1 Tax=Brevibacterium moorei TaxID=2968457 RepID=UPI00211C3FB9|nr:hypothetical protein [Brevibacterium sp. 68QC2CO]MCQ9385141.1 hypothetical protein [Brevibacterium sp. 68QC2CO]
MKDKTMKTLYKVELFGPENMVGYYNLDRDDMREVVNERASWPEGQTALLDEQLRRVTPKVGVTLPMAEGGRLEVHAMDLSLAEA